MKASMWPLLVDIGESCGSTFVQAWHTLRLIDDEPEMLLDVEKQEVTMLTSLRRYDGVKLVLPSPGTMSA